MSLPMPPLANLIRPFGFMSSRTPTRAFWPERLTFAFNSPFGALMQGQEALVKRHQLAGKYAFVDGPFNLSKLPADALGS
jgi:hypothetical protein